VSGTTGRLNFLVLSRRTRVLLAIWFLATLGLGAWGYYRYEAEAGASISILTALYHSAQLFILHAPHFEHPVNPALEAARWSAAILFGGTVFQAARQLFPSEFATLRFWRYSGHLVVGGLGRRGMKCVEVERAKSRKCRRPVVVIDRVPPDDLAGRCAELGVQVITGNVNDPAVLRAAGVHRAAELWALCGEDTVNCETAVQAGRLAAGLRKDPSAPLRCNVHLSDVDLRVELQRYASRARLEAPLALRFFDLFDFEARRVLRQDLPIDHAGIGPGEIRQPHLVILGFGRMGRSIAVRAAKLGHFANGLTNPGRRLRISVIDRMGTQNEAALLFRYPQFREVCQLEVHQLDIESPAARRLVEEWCGDPASLSSLVICFDDQARATEVALRLLPGLRPDAVRVGVRIADREGLGSLVEQVWAGAGPLEVRTFGRLDEGCCDAALDDENEILARAIHDDYAARRRAEGRDPSDRALASWEELDEDLRESNRQQADHILIKLRTAGWVQAPRSDPRPALDRFADPEVELLARMEHRRWNAERILAGWKRGPRDLDAKISPYLCEWEELPDEVREYDRSSVRAIPGLLDRIGMKAVRAG